MLTLEEFSQLKVSPAMGFPPTQTDCLFWVNDDPLPKIGHRQHDFCAWIENTGEEYYANEKQHPDEDVVCYIPLPEGWTEHPFFLPPTTIALPEEYTPEERERVCQLVEYWKEETWSDDEPGYAVRVGHLVTSAVHDRFAGAAGRNHGSPKIQELLRRINKEVFGADLGVAYCQGHA